MRSALARYPVTRPASLRDAYAALRSDSLTPIAGCTDVMVALNFGKQPPAHFMDIRGLAELRGIGCTAEGTLRIGALTTHADLMRSSDVAARLPILAAACSEIGGIQIQARGTIGGNIANGSPAGDTLPVLAAAEAIVLLGSAEGERRVPFNDFYTGYRTSVAAPDELILGVEIPPVDGRQWFRKVGTRAAQAISKVVIAAVRAPRPRIAIGSVAATVVRLPRTEAALGDDLSIEDAIDVLRTEIRPIDDIRSTAEYRLNVTANLLRRFWADTAA